VSSSASAPGSKRFLPERLTTEQIAVRLCGHEFDRYWRDVAACSGSETVRDFYSGADKPNAAAGPEGVSAKQRCWSCPVRWDCLFDAVQRRELFGIWGGLDASQRERIRRNHRGLYNDIVGYDSPHRVIARLPDRTLQGTG
jgi:hypothetical protein